jgi:hypothetical protein
MSYTPSFIEAQFPVSKISKESYKERKAGASQTLTGLGKWWGRKPLVSGTRNHSRPADAGKRRPAKRPGDLFENHDDGRRWFEATAFQKYEYKGAF